MRAWWTYSGAGQIGNKGAGSGRWWEDIQRKGRKKKDNDDDGDEAVFTRRGRGRRRLSVSVDVNEAVQ